jgi:phage tail sheath protein FI
MTSGADGSAPGTSDYIGTQLGKTGVWAWDKVPDVNFISLPGISDVLGATDAATVLKGVETYCETRGDVQCVFAVPSGKVYSAMKTWVTTTANFNSMYMTCYGPYVYAIDQQLGVKALKDPTGRILGAVARTHQVRNFAKAPAGITDGQIRGIYGLEYNYDEGSAEYDVVFPVGINLIIKFEGEGYAIWGDATLDATGEFDSIGEVTGFNIAKREIRRRTRFVNFEFNDATTRSRVSRVLQVLFRQWRLDGVLQGNKDDEAFFIICDESNNTPLIINQHKLVCRVGLAFQKSARFIEFTLEQDTRAVEAALASSV